MVRFFEKILSSADRRFARVAQLVEQRTENPRVGGSNPIKTLNLKGRDKKCPAELKETRAFEPYNGPPQKYSTKKK